VKKVPKQAMVDGLLLMKSEESARTKQLLMDQFERNRRNHHFLIVYVICLFCSLCSKSLAA
jgi:formate hydrogenlyase subunit 6/NADH:ubiquinone oxidoreductase subunit I